MPPRTVPGTHCGRLGGPREPAWDLGKEQNLAPAGIRTPNRPARSLVTTDYAIPASLFKEGGESNPPPQKYSIRMVTANCRSLSLTSVKCDRSVTAPSKCRVSDCHKLCTNTYTTSLPLRRTPLRRHNMQMY